MDVIAYRRPTKLNARDALGYDHGFITGVPRLRGLDRADVATKITRNRRVDAAD